MQVWSIDVYGCVDINAASARGVWMSLSNDQSFQLPHSLWNAADSIMMVSLWLLLSLRCRGTAQIPKTPSLLQNAKHNVGADSFIFKFNARGTIFCLWGRFKRYRHYYFMQADVLTVTLCWMDLHVQLERAAAKERGGFLGSQFLFEMLLQK